jgi:hypothetical protein
MEEQKKDVDVHIENQEILSKNHGVKLKEISEQEQKSNQLKRFLARWDSPLINHTDYIVETADQFGIDYRLIPAIAVVESSACNINFRPYNCWGWGKSGFANYEQGIYTVSKGLAYGYGTSNPHIIGPRYNPVTPDAWASKVSMLMTQIQ